jgi:flagellar hook-associated protein 1 FlgK
MNNSTFMGMDIALRGLYSSQRGLTTVSHNVDNTNTPGYSRQVVDQRAARPMMVANSAGMLGMGSDIVAVNRVRDAFIDEKFWSENQYLGEWEVKGQLIDDLQTLYNEPSTSGFSTILNDFYAGLQQLSTDPSSLSTRAMVMERGVMVAKYFNSVATHFEKLQDDVNNMVDAKVKQINSLGDQVRELNQQIYNYEITGNIANDLRDRRGYVVDQLSKLVNVQAYEVDTGYKLPTGENEKRFMVTISGKALVDHVDVVHLQAEMRETKLNAEDLDNLYEISWEDGNTLNIRSGELRGYLDMRDGNDAQVGVDGETKSPNYRGIPYYMNKMNEFVQVFAQSFNEGYIDKDGNGTVDKINGHVDGYTLSSLAGDPPAGIRFFTMKDANGQPMGSAAFQAQAMARATADGVSDDVLTPDVDEALMYGYKQLLTAKNFSISFEISSDPSENLAVSDTAGQTGNANNLISVMGMRHNTYMFREGAPEDFVKTLISSLGVDGQQAAVFLSTQDGITKQIVNRRESISGVSINEEMTNMVKYQQIYAASAKMISTYEELLNILVNGMV